MHYAVFWERIEIISFLLQLYFIQASGADIKELAHNLNRNIYISCFAIAIIKQNLSRNALLLILYKFLVLKNLDLLFNIELETLSLVHLACLKNDVEILIYLLQNGDFDV